MKQIPIDIFNDCSPSVLVAVWLLVPSPFGGMGQGAAFLP